jgi:branched-subunit amino acid aminotransferase/4-amino-4-deoxychorismate lyase
MTLLALAVSGRGLVDPNELAVYADDEGFLRGRAAFTTTRVYGGRPFRLEAHLSRLADSAQRLGLPAPNTPEIELLAAEALDASGVPDAMLRVYFTPGREGRGEPIAHVLVASLPPDLEETRERGIGLISVRLGQEGPPLLGGVKSTSYALNMLAVDEARRRGADDAIFLALGDVVLEGTTTNVWWRRGETLFTPAVGLGVLAGVTRAVLLEAAPGLGYEVEEGSFPVADLLAAEEAFTTSSVREVVPAVSLDGERIGEGRPGRAAQDLQAALRAAATLEQ